jgi:hypothetical protein
LEISAGAAIFGRVQIVTLIIFAHTYLKVALGMLPGWALLGVFESV